VVQRFVRWNLRSTGFEPRKVHRFEPARYLRYGRARISGPLGTSPVGPATGSYVRHPGSEKGGRRGQPSSAHTGLAEDDSTDTLDGAFVDDRPSTLDS
jgi:hypothetical protein